MYTIVPLQFFTTRFNCVSNSDYFMIARTFVTKAVSHSLIKMNMFDTGFYRVMQGKY